jgi:hypothetical protein
MTQWTTTAPAAAQNSPVAGAAMRRRFGAHFSKTQWLVAADPSDMQRRPRGDPHCEAEPHPLDVNRPATVHGF